MAKRQGKRKAKAAKPKRGGGVHLSRDDRELLGRALTTYKEDSRREMKGAPREDREYLEGEISEADHLAVKLDLLGDYYELEPAAQEALDDADDEG